MSGGSRYSKDHWFYSALSVLQAQLVSRNMDKSITHQALVQLSEVFQLFHMRPHSLPWKWKCNTVCFQGLKSVILFFSLQEVTELKKEIIPLKKKLEPYMDLSPVCLFSLCYWLLQTPQPNPLICFYPFGSCFLRTNDFIKTNLKEKFEPCSDVWKRTSWIWVSEFCFSSSKQSPSLAQVKIEEAKRELVSILKTGSILDEMWWLIYWIWSHFFVCFQAALDSQLEMNVDFKWRFV